MEWYVQGLRVAVAILLLLAIRMPLGFVFGVVGAAGILITTGRFTVLIALAQSLHDMLSDFVLITIPLFVLMAELLSAGGFIPDLYESVEKWTGRVRGSLAIATIVASAIFAAVCGSSYVTAASLGRMTMPEMLERGYKKHLAAGSIAAGGSLGILIPPSLAFVIYGYMSGAFHRRDHPGNHISNTLCTVHRRLDEALPRYRRNRARGELEGKTPKHTQVLTD
jgi:C4-dicarboxylate transporter DctM subunit